MCFSKIHASGGLYACIYVDKNSSKILFLNRRRLIEWQIWKS